MALLSRHGGGGQVDRKSYLSPPLSKRSRLGLASLATLVACPPLSEIERCGTSTALTSQSVLKGRNPQIRMDTFVLRPQNIPPLQRSCPGNVTHLPPGSVLGYYLVCYGVRTEYKALLLVADFRKLYRPPPLLVTGVCAGTQARASSSLYRAGLERGRFFGSYSPFAVSTSCSRLLWVVMAVDST